MIPPFHAHTRRVDAAPEALVVHCSDHRFQAGFREFLAMGLGLSTYALIATPGGGHFLTLEHVLPKVAKIGRQSMAFHVDRARPRRIVLVGHDDCLFFRERVEFFVRGPDLNAKQAANLRRARAIAVERFPGLPVDLFFAHALADGSLEFTAVA
jgi:hypothetical protein